MGISSISSFSDSTFTQAPEDQETEAITNVALDALDGERAELDGYFWMYPVQPIQHDIHFPSLLNWLAQRRIAQNPKTEPEPTQWTAVSANLQTLVEKGYNRLATILDTHDGFPWDDIRSLGEPRLMQQLADLVELTQGAAGGEHLIRFALAHARHSIAANEVLDGSQDLAFLLALVNSKGALWMADQIDDSASPESILTINREFQLLLGEFKGKFDEHVAAHEKTQLQDSALAKNSALPRFLADFLILQSGAVNFGLIAHLKANLVPSDARQKGYGVELLRGLTLLANSPSLRDKLARIEAPAQEGSPSSKLIWHALDLDPGTRLTHVHAKRVALGAMLSHLRQGYVGSCFATFLGIEVMRSRIGRFMEDMHQILKEGKLTVLDENGIEEDYPFLLRLSHDSSGQSFQVERDGRIRLQQGPSGYLWEAPGVRAACQAAGIKQEEIQEVVASALARSWADASPETTLIEMANHSLLKLLASEIQERTGKHQSEVFQTLVIAFEGETTSQTLRVWEYTLASMAEGRNDSYMKERTLGSLATALNNNLNKFLQGYPELKQELVGRIAERFLERVVLQYDPAITDSDTSADGHSTSGGFVLYDKNGSKDSEKWLRVDSAESYRNLIAAVILETQHRLESDPAAPMLGPMAPVLLDSLQRYVSMPQSLFIHECATIYNYGFVYPGLPLANPDRLQHTPWLDRIGNMPQSVWKVYFGEPLAVHERIVPTNAQDLLEQLVQRCKGASEEAKRYFKENPDTELPVRTPGQHAFSLLPGAEKLRALWENPDFDSQWVKENLVKPGQEIGHSVINAEAKETLLNKVESELISDGKEALFRSAVQRLSPMLTYKQVREELVTIIQQVEGFGKAHPDQIRNRLNGVLFSSLSEEQREALKSRAIEFADTNWNNGELDIHFTFIFNPFSDQLEVWRSLDGGRLVGPMSQNAWVTRPWEFAQHLEDPLPKNGEEVPEIDEGSAPFAFWDDIDKLAS